MVPSTGPERLGAGPPAGSPLPPGLCLGYFQTLLLGQNSPMHLQASFTCPPTLGIGQCVTVSPDIRGHKVTSQGCGKAL